MIFVFIVTSRFGFFLCFLCVVEWTLKNMESIRSRNWLSIHNREFIIVLSRFELHLKSFHIGNVKLTYPFICLSIVTFPKEEFAILFQIRVQKFSFKRIAMTSLFCTRFKGHPDQRQLHRWDVLTHGDYFTSLEVTPFFFSNIKNMEPCHKEGYAHPLSLLLRSGHLCIFAFLVFELMSPKM